MQKIRVVSGLRGLVMVHERFRQGYSNMGSSKKHICIETRDKAQTADALENAFAVAEIHV